MKHAFLSLLLFVSAGSAFAQFPLGFSEKKIKSYFDQNISYASAVDFKTANGTSAVCFTKVKVVGDYTFFFNASGICTSYIVTYDKNELKDFVTRLDYNYCRIQSQKWEAEDSTFQVSVSTPKPGENYFSVTYQPVIPGNSSDGVLAAN